MALSDNILWLVIGASVVLLICVCCFACSYGELFRTFANCGNCITCGLCCTKVRGENRRGQRKRRVYENERGMSERNTDRVVVVTSDENSKLAREERKKILDELQLLRQTQRASRTSRESRASRESRDDKSDEKTDDASDDEERGSSTVLLPSLAELNRSKGFLI